MEGGVAHRQADIEWKPWEWCALAAGAVAYAHPTLFPLCVLQAGVSFWAAWCIPGVAGEACCPAQCLLTAACMHVCRHLGTPSDSGASAVPPCVMAAMAHQALPPSPLAPAQSLR